MFKIYDGREHFWQWDLNQKLIVEDPTVNEVHFCNRTEDGSLVVEVYEDNGLRVANVPNILLQEDWKIKTYAYSIDHTKYEAWFNVATRCKPADYVYTETEVKTWEKLENQVLAAIDETGYYFPTVSATGDLSWRASKPTMPAAPQTVNIKGDPGEVSLEYLEANKPGKIVGNHAEIFNSNNVADGENSHAEGRYNEVHAQSAHVEGQFNIIEAAAAGAHVEGSRNTASSVYAHAEGMQNVAGGDSSHAEGVWNTVNGHQSHVEGYHNIASGVYQHVEGRYNIEDANNTYAHIVGNGTAEDARSNAHTLDWNGNAWYIGTVQATDFLDAEGNSFMVKVNNRINEVIGGIENGSY